MSPSEYGGTLDLSDSRLETEINDTLLKNQIKSDDKHGNKNDNKSEIDKLQDIIVNRAIKETNSNLLHLELLETCISLQKKELHDNSKKRKRKEEEVVDRRKEVVKKEEINREEDGEMEVEEGAAKEEYDEEEDEEVDEEEEGEEGFDFELFLQRFTGALLHPDIIDKCMREALNWKQRKIADEI